MIQFDPNETLRKLRTISKIESFEGEEVDNLLAEMQDLFNGLDESITNGGFLPDPWNYPNEILRRIREITNRFHQKATYEDMDELVELSEVLDERLSKGSFPPRDWQHMSCQHSDHKNRVIGPERKRSDGTTMPGY